MRFYTVRISWKKNYSFISSPKHKVNSFKNALLLNWSGVIIGCSLSDSSCALMNTPAQRSNKQVGKNNMKAVWRYCYDAVVRKHISSRAVSQHERNLNLKEQASDLGNGSICAPSADLMFPRFQGMNIKEPQGGDTRFVRWNSAESRLVSKSIWQ